MGQVLRTNTAQYSLHSAMRFFILLLSVLNSCHLGHARDMRDLQSMQFPFLDPVTLMLKTTWGKKNGKAMNQRVCRKLEMFLYERRWTGGLARTDCGNGVFECEVNDEGNIVIEMDIRRCRVQQFRSYQLCLSEGEDVCTMLFSLEMKIPYIETEQSSTEGNFTETDDIEDNTKESDKIGDQIEDKIEEGNQNQTDDGEIKDFKFFVGNILSIINSSTAATQEPVTSDKLLKDIEDDILVNDKEETVKNENVTGIDELNRKSNETVSEKRKDIIFVVRDFLSPVDDNARTTTIIRDSIKIDLQNADSDITGAIEKPIFDIQNKTILARKSNETVLEKRKDFNFFVGDFLSPVDDNPGKTTITSDSIKIDNNVLENADPELTGAIENPILDIQNKTNLKFAIGDILNIVDNITMVTKKTKESTEIQRNLMDETFEKKENQTIGLENEMNLKDAIDDILDIVDHNTITTNETFIIETEAIDVMNNVSQSFHNISDAVANVIKTKDKVIAKQKVEIVKLGTIVELCLFVLLAVGLIVAVGCLCIRGARWC